MAKKRKAKTAPRRRRMSGIGSSSTANLVYIVGGALAAQAITKFLPASMDDKIKSAIPFVAGFLAPRFVRGASGLALSAGLMAVGAVKVANSFGVMAGIGETPMIAAYNRSRRMLSGMENETPTPQVAGISGLGKIRTLAALEES